MTSVNEMLLEVESLLISCQDKKTWYKEGLELISKSSNQSNPEPYEDKLRLEKLDPYEAQIKIKVSSKTK